MPFDPDWKHKHTRVLAYKDESGKTVVEEITVFEYECRKKKERGSWTEAQKEAYRKMQDDRKPLPPEILASALQDNIHRDIGRGRPAKTIKVKMK